MQNEETQTAALRPGLVLHRAAAYDLMLWFFTLGRERNFRQKLLRFARLQPGEAVLDVGCGTGTLAIVAKGQVGPSGTVCGIDASPEMIARARTKAKKAGVDVALTHALAQSLPFPDSYFDAVITTVMLHHLSRAARRQLAGEMRRVLKPGGRVLAIDFAEVPAPTTHLLPRFHRHGRLDLREILTMLTDAGLQASDSGPVGVNNLQFVRAMRPR